MIDTSKVGMLAAELMEKVEEAYGPAASLGVVAVVAEVDVPGDERDADDTGYTEILYRCSDNRRWIQDGFFRAAARAVMYATPLDEED